MFDRITPPGMHLINYTSSKDMVQFNRALKSITKLASEKDPVLSGDGYYSAISLAIGLSSPINIPEVDEGVDNYLIRTLRSDYENYYQRFGSISVNAVACKEAELQFLRAIRPSANKSEFLKPLNIILDSNDEPIAFQKYTGDKSVMLLKRTPEIPAFDINPGAIFYPSMELNNHKNSFVIDRNHFAGVNRFREPNHKPPFRPQFYTYKEFINNLNQHLIPVVSKRYELKFSRYSVFSLTENYRYFPDRFLINFNTLIGSESNFRMLENFTMLDFNKVINDAIARKIQ